MHRAYTVCVLKIPRIYPNTFHMPSTYASYTCEYVSHVIHVSLCQGDAFIAELKIRHNTIHCYGDNITTEVCPTLTKRQLYTCNKTEPRFRKNTANLVKSQNLPSQTASAWINRVPQNNTHVLHESIVAYLFECHTHGTSLTNKHFHGATRSHSLLQPYFIIIIIEIRNIFPKRFFNKNVQTCKYINKKIMLI